ncbi:hypothetical protein ACLOJK_034346, partial [Asimina triloba]
MGEEVDSHFKTAVGYGTRGGESAVLVLTACHSGPSGRCTQRRGVIELYQSKIG